MLGFLPELFFLSLICLRQQLAVIFKALRGELLHRRPVRRARTSLHRHGAKTRVLRVLDGGKRAGKDDRIVLLRVQALHRALEHRAAVRLAERDGFCQHEAEIRVKPRLFERFLRVLRACLLYTSDAADE